jgi:hypothetical protein
MVLTGYDEFEQFGYDLDLTFRKDLGMLIAVSSVGKRAQLDNSKMGINLNRAGQVNVFILNSNGSSELITTFKSDRQHSLFGSKVKVNIFQILF